MTTELAPAGAAVGSTTARRLVLIWQHPTTRQFIRVGHLDELSSDSFAFTYETGATTDGFVPLVEFPDLGQPHVSNRLPAFFENRVMDRGRSGYTEYRGWLGLGGAGADTPFEVMRRTGGGRATDTFHVVDDLRSDGRGMTTRFFVSGIRHVPGGAETVATLVPGATWHCGLSAPTPGTAGPAVGRRAGPTDRLRPGLAGGGRDATHGLESGDRRGR